MGYLRPTTAPITDDWQEHRDRKPPSAMPGTDYACSYGTPVLCADPGVVTYVNYSTASSSGRGVDVRLNDGRTVAYIHLSADIRVKVGDKVGRGHVLAMSGASGKGKDRYYGPHVHVTLWSGIPWQSTNLDFERYVGGSTAGTLEPTQRMTLVLAKRRIGAPSITAPEGDKSTWLTPGTVANFVGWQTGDTVDGNSVWFKGTSGDYFWSGSFQGGADTSGLANLNPIAPNQRTAKNDSTPRTGPGRQYAAVGDAYKAGTVGTFDGWMHGESVEGQDIWIRGALTGSWFWITPWLDARGVEGLTDLNPPKPTPKNTRTVGPNEANVRVTPWLASSSKEKVAGGTELEISGYGTGELVQGISTWFRRASDGSWLWAGGFTSQSTEGLTLVPDVPTPPKTYTFRAFDPVVTRVAPAALGNFEYGRFPTKVDGLVLHDYGKFGIDTFNGTVAWFQNASSVTSAHFVVSGENVVQMVDLVDRAYHAGPNGNDLVGIEVDPVVGQPDGTPGKAETIASVRALLAALEKHYGYMPKWHRHSEFMNTTCGDDIDFDDYAPPPAEVFKQVRESDLIAWADALAKTGLSIDSYVDA